MGELKKAEIQYKFGKRIADKNVFARWQNFARLLNSRILLKKPEVNLRNILRILIKCEEISDKMDDWMVQLQSLVFITLIYRIFHSKRHEKQYREKLDQLLEYNLKNLKKNDQKKLKNHFLIPYVESTLKVEEIISNRKHITRTDLQHILFDLLQYPKIKQIKFHLKKIFKELLGADKFSLFTFDEIKQEKRIWLDGGFPQLKGIHSEKFEILKNTLSVQYYKYNKLHYSLSPLILKDELTGCLCLCDDGEMNFRKTEKKKIKFTSFYLTVILRKMDEYQQVKNQKEQFSDLLKISRDILQVMDMPSLKNHITQNAMKLTNAEKGYFLTLDENNNLIFEVGLLSSGEFIDKNDYQVDRNIVRNTCELGDFIRKKSAKREKLKLLQNKQKSKPVLCVPINVHNKLYGSLYLDEISEQTSTSNLELMQIFLLMIETAIKNCIDYEKLEEANKELLNIEQERTQFINISSHEFNTPIQILKGYMKILQNVDVSESVKKTFFKYYGK